VDRGGGPGAGCCKVAGPRSPGPSCRRPPSTCGNRHVGRMEACMEGQAATGLSTPVLEERGLHHRQLPRAVVAKRITGAPVSAESRLPMPQGGNPSHSHFPLICPPLPTAGLAPGACSCCRLGQPGPCGGGVSAIPRGRGRWLVQAQRITSAWPNSWRQLVGGRGSTAVRIRDRGGGGPGGPGAVWPGWGRGGPISGRRGG